MKYQTCIMAFLGFAALGFAQPVGHPTRMIREAVNEQKLVSLAGNTRPEANAANDRGAVDDDFKLGHMQLHLKRSPEREAALTQYIDDLHNAKSPNYHKWLTPEQFAEHYGVATEDVATVKSWLTSHGFTVHGVPASGLVIDFSGTAGQIRSAYHTEIHNLEVNGKKHYANTSDPQIPAAFDSVVTGIVCLHNFHPKPTLMPRGNYTFTTSNGTFHALVPGDIATIYNLNPVFAAGYTGKGQSIMVVEDTYLYSVNDFTIFRKTFGLTRPYPSGNLTQVSPAGAITCTNPGFQGNSADPGYGDDGEAAIDVEWATAAAPNASIILAACTDTSAFGGLIALQNTLNGPAASLPSVVSISYGESEAANGAAANAAYNIAYQQAVAEGVSIFVSSGDEDAASSDDGNVSRDGIAISGFASTPFNVAVGGTDFGYTANNIPPSTYWNATNTNVYSSALSYIQEIPWNDSCAGGLIAAFLGTTPAGLCNSTQVTSPSGALNFLLNAAGGSGGPSGCATGTASTRNVVSGTCAGYAKPAFQAGLFGNPNDGVRDIPDVALFASNGLWDAYYVVCWSNPDTNPSVGGGFVCTGPPSSWAGFGGTSVSSPIMAAIQALVNQKTGSRWGNPNTVYYSLASTEYGAAGSSACNSSLAGGPASSCIFYDITQGDNDGACRATGTTLRNCFRPTGTNGILSTSKHSFAACLSGAHRLGFRDRDRVSECVQSGDELAIVMNRHRNKMKTTCALICISFGLFLGAPQGNATPSFCTGLPGNLVGNCGFETGGFTGWTLAGNDVPGAQGSLYDVEGQDPLDSISPNSGNDQAFIADLVANATTLSQTITTVAGAQYAVSLFLAQDTQPGTGLAPNSNELIVAFGGVTLATVTGIPVQGYTQYSYTGVASSTSSVLAITIGNDLGQSLLDDVSVIGAPEPSTWGLMAAGLICFLGRKRFGRRVV